MSKTCVREKAPFSTNGAGKTGHPRIEAGIRFLFLTLYKNQFKMDQRRPETLKQQQRNHLTIQA
jgi:hypothetical protein